MGVFDDVKIEYQLLPDLPQGGWQTKTLDCNGGSFILTKEGRLLERVREIELQDGAVRETGEWKTIDRNFEGVFRVYRPFREKWYEFEIVMINGLVEQVRQV